jgi:SAM-dependent methyltransferase
MNTFNHEDQQRIWDEEHKNPNVLLQMDSEDASSGVVKFWDFLKSKNLESSKGIEMGCGKGRNVIWLAEKGIEMFGFDFSSAAIEEANRRKKKIAATSSHFKVQDATKPWDYESDYFDFAIDCFASTDIESEEGRMHAMSELYRVLKPGGYMLAYLLSTDDEFHKEMIIKNPATEKNAFHHSTGKYERTFDQTDIDNQYKDFKLIHSERIEKTAQFFGKDYACRHFWLVLQKS